jgi:hypothetical protein
MNFIVGSQYDYPTPSETIALAQRARFHGMTIETEPTGAHVVVEPKTGRRYFVTLVSCQCRQFIGSGSCTCQHLALLQTETGMIPEAVAAVEMESVR